MNNNKSKIFLFAGIFLGYFGLKDLGNFALLYNGIAILASVGAFFMAYLEYQKDRRGKE